MSREEVYNGKVKAFDKQLWAGCVDPVGGESLAVILSSLQYNGSASVSINIIKKAAKLTTSLAAFSLV